MPLLTVEGEYKDGMVKLTEPPAGVEQARVLVTFLPKDDQSPPGEMIQFGMLRTQEGREASWQDFQDAKRAMYKHLGDDDDQARG